MQAQDVDRLIRIIVEELTALRAEPVPAPTRCTCHAHLYECCPDRLRGVLDAGATPAGVLVARTTELPAALQRFRPHGLPEVASSGGGSGPLAIAYPPDGARIDMEVGGGALALKALGGVPPFTWLVDGVPVASRELRRQSLWERPGPGFARLSVIDAAGRTASASGRKTTAAMKPK